jgi:hypothetical protein
MILMKKNFLNNWAEIIFASQQTGKGREITKVPRV